MYSKITRIPSRCALSVLLSSLLFLLSSCTKEASWFPDKGCEYLGQLDVKVTESEKGSAVFVQTNGGSDYIGPDVSTNWGQEGAVRDVTIGNYLIAYLPLLSEGYDPDASDYVLTAARLGDGVVRSFVKPIKVKMDHARVEWQQTTKVVLHPERLSRSLSIRITNKTDRDFMDVRLTADGVYGEYDLKKSTYALPSKVYLDGTGSVVSPGYTFDRIAECFAKEVPTTLTVEFSDPDGTSYTLTFADAFEKTIDPYVFASTIVIDKETLLTHGAKVVEVVYKYEGLKNEYLLGGKGDPMTLSLLPTKITRTIQYGKVIDERSEPFSFELRLPEGDHPIKVERGSDPSTLVVRGTRNDTGAERTLVFELVRPDGKATPVVVKQKKDKFVVEGELQ